MRARIINEVIRELEVGMRPGDTITWRGYELIFTHFGWYTGHAYFERVDGNQEVCIPIDKLPPMRRSA